jgi:hypothetical protein
MIHKKMARNSGKGVQGKNSFEKKEDLPVY